MGTPVPRPVVELVGGKQAGAIMPFDWGFDPSAHIRAACLHARSTYPYECCGVIRESGVIRSRNMAFNRLAQHSGTAGSTRRSFALDAPAVMLIAESLGGTDPVVAIYHSHPDGDACMSKADRVGAMTYGRITWPTVQHFIIACQKDHISEARLFSLSEQGALELARLGPVFV